MRLRSTLALSLSVLAGLAACTGQPAARVESPAGRTSAAGSDGMMAAMESLSQAYVKLVLELGERDAGYVDAYYGPPEWKTEAAARHRSLG
jgi:ABC-type phosphate transport system substrate-binding protein